MAAVVPRSAAELELLLHGNGTPAERRAQLARIQSLDQQSELPPPSTDAVIAFELLRGRAGHMLAARLRALDTALAAAQAAGSLGSRVPLPLPYGRGIVVGDRAPAYLAGARPEFLRPVRAGAGVV